jgi:hypothetical protein
MPPKMSGAGDEKEEREYIARKSEDERSSIYSP